MKREVITNNCIEGFHCYPQAKGNIGYLSARHRHIFEIRCWAKVTHNEREIEINTEQNRIESAFNKAFGAPCEFGDMSCESIAEWLLGEFPEMSKVQVLEDGYGGAALTR